MRRCTALSILFLTLLGSPEARAAYLDLTSLTASPAGSFAGTLNGVGVTGSITANDGSFTFFAVGTTYNSSTLDNTSPQYSYSNIYSPTNPLGDRIGTGKFFSAGSSTVTITFASAILNPVFEIANLDGAKDTFLLTGGLTGLSLLSGNGGGGDGLGLVGNALVDLNPGTVDGSDPPIAPPTSGARSAYGSVQLLGNITTLTFNVTTAAGGTDDGGNFTLSTSPAAVPEPHSAILLGLGIVILPLVAFRNRSGRRRDV